MVKMSIRKCIFGARFGGFDLDPSIERGGVAAYGFDYYDIGVQTGRMIARVLDAGSANSIEVEKGEIISLSINTEAAESMGVTIPQNLIDKAAVIYGV